MENKELLMCLQAISVFIARKKQKINHRKRKLEQLQSADETGLHRLKRSIYGNIKEVEEFEQLKDKFQKEFNERL